MTDSKGLYKTINGAINLKMHIDLARLQFLLSLDCFYIWKKWFAGG